MGVLGGVGWMLASKVIDFESRETPPPVVEEVIAVAETSTVQELERTELEGMDEGQGLGRERFHLPWRWCSSKSLLCKGLRGIRREIVKVGRFGCAIEEATMGRPRTR